MNIEDEIKKFVLENIFSDPHVKIGLDDDFVRLGYVNSFGILEIVAFIEDTYNVNFEAEDFIEDNFSSLTSIFKTTKFRMK